MTDERSRYDALYDKYSDAHSPKKGTKYERLVAFVMKALEADATVIHDVKLVGESEVKHQIDVQVTRNGQLKRTLIECKDFDVANRPVGLSIIRDFRSVVEDVRPDTAIVITCCGFTRDAQKFAKSKGIKLAVLRQFEDSDWDGKIKTVQLRFHIMMISEPIPSIFLSSEEAQQKLNNDLVSIGASDAICEGQPVFVHEGGKKVQINEFISGKAHDHPRDAEGPVRLVVKGCAIEVDNRGRVPLDAMTIQFNVYHDDEFYEITSKKVAELILSPVEGSDIVIFEEDLKKCRINEETGEIEASDV